MTTEQKTITLTTVDHLVLETRLARMRATDPRNRATCQSLREELARASLLPAEAMPPSIVRLGSTFTVRDLDAEENDTFTLVLPEQADLANGRLSVFTPLGVALLGYSVGDEVTWPMPGGLRRMRLLEVAPPPTK